MSKLEKILTAAVTAFVLAAAPFTLSSAALAGGHGGGFNGGHGGGRSFGGGHGFHNFNGHGGFVGTNCWVFKQTPEGFKKVFVCG